MWRVFTLGCFVACAGSDTPTGDGPFGDDNVGTTDDDTPPTETDTDAPPDTDTSPPGEDCSEASAGVCGVLIDPAGQPLGNFDMLCCQITTCFKGETEDDGSFYFEVDPGPYVTVAVKTHEELFETPLRWGAALVPGAIATATPVQLGNVYIPDLPVGVHVLGADQDPQVIAAGDGLELTLNRGDLTPDLGVFLYDIAARRIPDDHVPATYLEVDEPVEAVYVIHPFATKSASPIAVKVPSTLPAGTLVHLRTVSHLDGRFSTVVGGSILPDTTPVIGHADGAYITTDPGQGITLLTHLVITKP